ncbi:MAG: 2-hydroxyacyl-CoA dehydratase family protein [Candidatus Eisenbacteria bacterium]
MPRLKSQEKLKTLLGEYYTSLSSPLAWCTSAGPAEILRALGFQVYFPENHGAILGASRLAEKYIPRAHQAGFGGEICSYLTSDIGAWLSGATPLREAYGLPSIPKPDLIVYCTNQCREVADWFGFFGRELGVPVVGIHPPRHLEEVAEDDIRHVVSRYRDLIRVGEEIRGETLDPKNLRRVVALSREGSDLWKRVLGTARRTPSPLSFFDGTILMAPIVILRGTRACVEFYEDLLRELEDGVGPAVPGERARIYWEGMPIWGRLRSLADFFVEQKAAVVASTYCNSWVFDDFDPDRPLESMALAYTRIFINRSENAKLVVIREMIDDFGIDGVVFHDSKTCFNNSNNRFGLDRRVREETGKPTIVVNGDLNDLRFFSDLQTRTILETFVMQIARD